MFLSIHGSKENSKTVVFNRSLSFITFFCQLPFRCVVILSKKMNYNFFRIFFNLPVIFLFLYTQEKGFRSLKKERRIRLASAQLSQPMPWLPHWAQ